MKLHNVRLLLIAIASLLVVSCAPAGAPTPTPAPPPAAKPAAEPAKPPAAPTKPAEPSKAAPAPTSPALKPAAGEPKPAGPMVTVRMGDIGSMADAGVYIALEKGYFKEEGINLDLVRFQTGAEMIAPMSAGQLEIGGGAISAGLFNAIGRDIPIKIVADRGSLPPGNGFIALAVRKDLIDGGQFKDYADFRGKKIAMPNLAIVSRLVVDRALEKGGLTSKDAEYISMAIPDNIPAFVNKSIDAAILNEPQLTFVQDRGIAVSWKGVDEVYPNLQFSVVMYAPHFARDQNEVAKRWMAAYLKGVRDYNDAFAKKDTRMKQGLLPILTKNTEVKEVAMWDKMVPAGLSPNGLVNAKTLEENQEAFVKIGQMKQTIDLKAVVDTQFVDYAVGRLGPYK